PLRKRHLDSAIRASERTIVCRNSDMAALDELTRCRDRKTASAVATVSSINPFLHGGKALVPGREVDPEFRLLAISCRCGGIETIGGLLQQLVRRAAHDLLPL